MEFEANGVVYEVKMNNRFIRALDKVYKIQESGLEMGMGVTFGYSALESYSNDALSKIVPLAIGKRLTESEVDNLLEAYAEENDGLGGLFEGLKEALENSPMTKDSIAKHKRNLELQG